MQLNLSFRLNLILLFASNFCLFWVLWLVKSDLFVSSSKTLPVIKGKPSSKTVTMQEKSKALTCICFVLFPLFAVNHLMTVLHVFTVNEQLIGNMLGGAVAKLGFCYLAINSHRNVLHTLVSKLDETVKPFIYNIVAVVDTISTPNIK